ncbi:MAG: 3-hydroxyacyl-CoA dehydrogenase family protein [Proteobacteria bacterium]|nr:3-hydroxyacyl-CoA dehydrogenase family protein [Pseudomonadota bacterium]
MNVDGIKVIGIIGAGLMGHGIAQIFGLNGYEVRLYDQDRSMLQSAPDRIRGNLKTFEALELIGADQAASCLEKVSLCEDMGRACAEAAVIIEAVKEDLRIKQSVFADMERFSSPETIFCSNTSGISIGGICEGLDHKARAMGTHFWNPPHVVPCVELIRSEFTADETVDTVFELMTRVGQVPVKVLKDVPGFIGNRLQHAMIREALYVVQAGIATPEDVDKVIKSSFGLRLPLIGAFETADLAGIDLAYDVQKYLVPFLCTDLKPLDVLKEKVEAGTLGVKSGRGFYEWDPEKIKAAISSRDSKLLRLIRLARGNE